MPVPAAVSEHVPWPLHKTPEGNGQPTPQVDVPQLGSHVQVPVPANPSLHAPCPEHSPRFDIPSHTPVQFTPKYPEAHTEQSALPQYPTDAL